MRRIKTFNELFEGATKKDKEEFPSFETLSKLPIYKKARKFLGDGAKSSSLGVREYNFGTSYSCSLKPSGDGKVNLIYGSFTIEKDMPFSTQEEMNDAMTKLILYSIAQMTYVSKISYSTLKEAVFNGQFYGLNLSIKRILDKLSKEELRTSSNSDSRGFPTGNSGIYKIYRQFKQLEFLLSIPGIKAGVVLNSKIKSDLAADLVRIAIKLDDMDVMTCLSDLGIVNGKKIENILDNHFTENPEDLYLLDDLPDLKSGVLKRTGIKDLSGTGRESNKVKWLNECTSGEWKINEETGLVDIKGTFRCNDWGIRNFQGIEFGHVTGDFNCSRNNITSLKGAPQTVDGGFNCSYNNLKNLMGAPEKVKSLACNNSNLESLIGSPQTVDGFDCSDNNLKTLEGAPQIVNGNFTCNKNKLESLEGGPRTVAGRFECQENKLKSLKGGPEIVEGEYSCTSNELTSLEGAPQFSFGFFCNDNKLVSLKGAPREIQNSFVCAKNKLKTLEGAPEIVGRSFQCYDNNLESLEGAPGEVGGYFICTGNNLKSLKGLPDEIGEYFSFDINGKKYIMQNEGRWDVGRFIEFFKEHPETFTLLDSIIGDSALDDYFKKMPLDIYMLDSHPDVKAGVIKRTGITDAGKIGKLLKRGFI
jgi:hypothetical protein